MNYQKLIIVGNATNDAERRTSKDGSVSYTTFGVGVSRGKDASTFFPVTVFGKHGQAVAEYITKGRQLLVEGRTTPQIASLLHISEKTVGTHRQHIMDKLDIHNIAALTKYALREGLTFLEP